MEDPKAPRPKLGHLNPETLSFVKMVLQTRPEALALFEEMFEKVRVNGAAEDPEGRDEIINKRRSDVAMAVRRAAYAVGAGNGAEEIQRSAESGATEMTIEGVKLSREQVILAKKTAASFEAIARISLDKRGKILGILRARHLEYEPEKTKEKMFKMDEAGKVVGLRDEINRHTPIDTLMNILNLAEMPEFAVNDIVQRTKRASLEFMIRRLVTVDWATIDTGMRFLGKRHFEAILRQMPDGLSEGRIGGKAGGIFLAHAALEQETPEFDIQFAKSVNKKLDDDGAKSFLEKFNIKQPEKWLKQGTSRFVGSGVFEQLVQSNESLADTSILKTYYQDGMEPPDGMHERLNSAMMGAEFPPHVLRQLRILFEEWHGEPIIVRSSSELEDKLGASFAGQYDSVELANSGDYSADFEAFKSAILQVYASVFKRDVMSYRKNRNLLGADEEMGILIQKLRGEKRGKHFSPDFSVVAMSRATQSIGFDPMRGAMRIGAGLGRTVVDAGGGRFLMFAKPAADFGRQTPKQQTISALNLETGSVDRRAIREISQGEMSRLVKNEMSREGGGLDFKNICSGKIPELPLIIEYIVQKLKYQLGYDVDCEFTVEEEKEHPGQWKVCLVQCRPQTIPENLVPSTVPENVPEEMKIASGIDAVNGTMCPNVEHLLYIDPAVYEKCSAKARGWIRNIVSALNAKYKNYFILAPRRWGSEEDSAGIKVGFADFSNAKGFAEIFDGGSEVSPSFGMHFSQAVLDAQMATCAFSNLNKDFFSGAENAEPRFIEETLRAQGAPEDVIRELMPYIKMIEVDSAYTAKNGARPAGSKKMVCHLAQNNIGEDGKERKATLYFAQNDKNLPVPVPLNGKEE